MKNYCIFAKFKPKNKFSNTRFAIAIFMAICLVQLIAKIRGYQIPVGYCTRALVCSLARMGGDSLSYFKYFNFSFTMPKNNEKASKVNNSTLTTTSTSTTTVSAPVPTILIESLYQLREIYLKVAKVYNASPIATECFSDDYNDFCNKLDEAAYALSDMARVELLENAYFREYQEKQNNLNRKNQKS